MRWRTALVAAVVVALAAMAGLVVAVRHAGAGRSHGAPPTVTPPIVTETPPGPATSSPSRSASSPGDVFVGPISVVALGDSVVSGSNCDCTPFPQRYATITARRTDHRTTVQDLGVPGLTTDGLLDQLDTRSARHAVRDADVVTVTIGANDLVAARSQWLADACTGCFVPAVQRTAAVLERVVRRVQQLRAGRPTEVLLTTYWNVFEDGDVARARPENGYLAMTERATDRLNSAIVAVGRRTGVVVVDLVGPFKGGGTDPTPLLADDGDHPDAAGHEVIAQALARHGWRELGLPS